MEARFNVPPASTHYPTADMYVRAIKISKRTES